MGVTLRAYPFGIICSTSRYSSSLPIRDYLLYESLLFELTHSGLSALRVITLRTHPFGIICSTSHYSSSLPIRGYLLYESLLYESFLAMSTLQLLLSELTHSGYLFHESPQHTFPTLSRSHTLGWLLSISLNPT